MRSQSRSFRLRNQHGFGLLETLTGLVVFVILAMVGLRAYHGVLNNQKESSQVKALTDAVSSTAERLSIHSVSALTAPGSAYLQWSVPAEIGLGEYRFRYRTFPNPSIRGVQDTTVVGLEVETGTMRGNAFTPNRSFATLIAPHLNSKNGLGQVSTAQERSDEAAFYASLRQQLADTRRAAVAANQMRLNSFNCYDKTQCCGFMQTYFANPLTVRPGDGLDEKCLYRCALGGAVPMKEWKNACHQDFCSISPWQTSDQCCAAINSGNCEPGSACAQACIDCVGEDGSNCGPPPCDKRSQWDDFFDCANGVMCDGTTPIPEGDLPPWGNVKALCGSQLCSGVTASCETKAVTCCNDYWAVLNRGETPKDHAQLCATISKPSECCNLPVSEGDWDPVYCSNGKFISGRNKIDATWYCGMKGSAWDDICAFTKGCSTTYIPTGAVGNCPAWNTSSSHVSITGPKDATFPKPPDPKPPADAKKEVSGSVATPKPKITVEYIPPVRRPSKRRGSRWGSWGGRE